MKIKIFNNVSKVVLESMINEFIDDKKIVDIKYSVCSVPVSFDKWTVNFSALVIYKEVNDL